MMDLFKQLSAPLHPERVSWRIGNTTQDKTKGMALAYIDARDVMDKLDAVVGPENWQCDYPHANGKTVCRIGIRVNGEWVWKADGAGDTDFEAEKGALSDAFKRAAVRWGIGRYLYDLGSPWVEIEPRGKSYVIKASEHARLRRLLGLDGPAPAPSPDPGLVKTLLAGVQKAAESGQMKHLEEWATTNAATISGLAATEKTTVRDAYRFAMDVLKQGKEAA